MTLIQAQQINPVPYRPQTIGLVERFHRTRKDILSLYVEEGSRDWDAWVRFAVYAYNSAKHTTVGLSPNELMMRRRLRALNELLHQEHITVAGELKEYYGQLVRQMAVACELSRKATDKEQLRQATYYNRKPKATREFHPGDKVWMYSPPRGKGITKFAHQWLGPLAIVQPAGYDNFLVRREDSDGSPEDFIAHSSFLVSYHYPRGLLERAADDIVLELEDEEFGPVASDDAESAQASATAPILTESNSGATGQSIQRTRSACGAISRNKLAPRQKRRQRLRKKAAVREEYRVRVVEIRRRRRRNRAG